MNSTIQVNYTTPVTQTVEEFAAANGTTTTALEAANPAIDFSGWGQDTSENSQFPSTYIIIPGLLNDTDYILDYTSQRGDTMNSVSARLGISPEQLAYMSPGLYPPSYSLDQQIPLEEYPLLEYYNPGYPGAPVLSVPAVMTAQETYNFPFVATDTIASLSKLLGVSEFDLVNANSFLAVGFVAEDGQINDQTPLGTTGNITYPNIVYPNFVSASALSADSLTLADVTLETEAQPTTTEPVTEGVTESSPVLSPETASNYWPYVILAVVGIAGAAYWYLSEHKGAKKRALKSAPSLKPG